MLKVLIDDNALKFDRIFSFSFGLSECHGWQLQRERIKQCHFVLFFFNLAKAYLLEKHSFTSFNSLLKIWKSVFTFS